MSPKPDKVRKTKTKIKKQQVKSKKPKTRNRRRGEVWAIIITILLVIGSLALAIPPNERIKQGLDIQGGLSVVLSAETTDGAPISAENLEKSRAIIEARVNALGASEATVTTQGTDQILVQIPGMSNADEALDAIGQTGVLEFASLDSITDTQKVNQIKNGGVDVVLEEETYTPVITGENIQQVTIGMASQTSTDYAVNLRLDGEGAREFGALTTELYPSKGQIAIILDGKVQSAPAVQSAITNGEVSITGNYSLEEAQALQTVLESGSLPVSFVYEQSQAVGPTLGQGELFAGVIAALAGLVVVIIYLLFFYRGLGLLEAANICVFAIFYLGVLALLSFAGWFALSLAGIAGIILTIGMAADTSILIVERFKEELMLGHTAKAASTTGVRNALITSVDANVVTVISALCLFFIATSSVKGFGLTLALGIFINIFVMLIFTSPLIRVLAAGTIMKHPGFWGVKKSLAYAQATRDKTYTYLDEEDVTKIKKSPAKLIEPSSNDENAEQSSDTVISTLDVQNKKNSSSNKRKRHSDGNLGRNYSISGGKNKRPFDKTKKKEKTSTQHNQFKDDTYARKTNPNAPIKVETTYNMIDRDTDLEAIEDGNKDFVVTPVLENFDLDATQDIIEELEEARIVSEVMDGETPEIEIEENGEGTTPLDLTGDEEINERIAENVEDFVKDIDEADEVDSSDEEDTISDNIEENTAVDTDSTATDTSSTDDSSEKEETTIPPTDDNDEETKSGDDTTEDKKEGKDGEE